MVVDAVTKRPVSRALLAVGDKRQQRTDSGGQFRFASLSTGEYLVHVHFLGYEDASERIAVRADSELYRKFVLTPLPAILREVVVSERIDAVPQRLVDAYNRAAKANGFFFNRRDIAHLNPQDFQTLLNRIPTVSANDRGITFQRCQAGLGAQDPEQQQAKVQVWIDGYRVSGRNPTETVNDILQTIHPTSIELMEVYTGVARIPAEFLEDACAVIVLWTKRF